MRMVRLPSLLEESRSVILQRTYVMSILTPRARAPSPDPEAGKGDHYRRTRLDAASQTTCCIRHYSFVPDIQRYTRSELKCLIVTYLSTHFACLARNSVSDSVTWIPA